MFCLLDLVLDARRGRHPNYIILLAPALCEELLVVAALATAMLIDQPWSGSLAVVGALLVITGAAVAGVFARLGRSRTPERLVAPLYASDLLGGGVGSLAAGLYFIPLWGLMGSALAAATIALLATAPLILGRK